MEHDKNGDSQQPPEGDESGRVPNKDLTVQIVRLNNDLVFLTAPAIKDTLVDELLNKRGHKFEALVRGRSLIIFILSHRPSLHFSLCFFPSTSLFSSFPPLPFSSLHSGTPFTLVIIYSYVLFTSSALHDTITLAPHPHPYPHPHSHPHSLPHTHSHTLTHTHTAPHPHPRNRNRRFWTFQT